MVSAISASTLFFFFNEIQTNYKITYFQCIFVSLTSGYFFTLQKGNNSLFLVCNDAEAGESSIRIYPLI